MIKGIACEGDYEHLKNNEFYIKLIEKLEASDKKYLAGISLPSKSFNDYPVITWMSYEYEGGDLTVEDSKIIPISPSFQLDIKSKI